MPTYSLDGLQGHWASSVAQYKKEHGDCRAVFEQVVHLASIVAGCLVSRRAMAPNCCYLLLAKALNHSLATFVLAERGLSVDAALTSRNALETLLLLELLSKRSELCQEWANGREFKPSEVRNHLSQNPSTEVGDLVINVTGGAYEDARFVYGWLSKITHANLESLNFATSSAGDNAFTVHVGGQLSRPVLVALAKVIGTTFVRSLLTCCAAHAPLLLEERHADFKVLEARLAALGRGVPTPSALE